MYLIRVYIEELKNRFLGGVGNRYDGICLVGITGDQVPVA